VLLSPKQSDDLGYDRVWRVMWESGSYAWGIDLSCGSVTFIKHDGYWDRSEPEIVIGNPEDWYLESYYSFDVGFIPNTTYAEFDEEQNGIITIANVVSEQLIREIAKHPKILQTIEVFDYSISGRKRSGYTKSCKQGNLAANPTWKTYTSLIDYWPQYFLVEADSVASKKMLQRVCSLSLYKQ
jgi:hypothetical protein